MTRLIGPTVLLNQAVRPSKPHQIETRHFFDRLLYCRHNFLALTFYISWHYDLTHDTESICLALSASFAPLATYNSGLVPLEIVRP